MLFEAMEGCASNGMLRVRDPFTYSPTVTTFTFGHLYDSLHDMSKQEVEGLFTTTSSPNLAQRLFDSCL